MKKRGRPSKGSALVEKLEGSSEAKRRLRVIVEALREERSVGQACDDLGVKEARYHQMRDDALQGALQALEPRPTGRPPTPPPTLPEEDAERLRAEIERLKMEVRAAHIREELAVAFPNRLRRPKGDPPAPKAPAGPPTQTPGPAPASPGPLPAAPTPPPPETAQASQGTATEGPGSGTPAPAEGAQGGLPAVAAQTGGGIMQRMQRRHAERLLEAWEARRGATKARRGLFTQWGRRASEREVRKGAVAFWRWARRKGLALRAAARQLGVGPTTLTTWEGEWKSSRMKIVPRGRKIERSSREARNLVIAVFNLAGPGLGLPTLETLFPDMPRSEIVDLMTRYRRLWQRGKGSVVLHVLKWTMPGAVWAMDFTETPNPIEGKYPYILAVRDLATGYQLLSLPVTHEDAYGALSALKFLFDTCGPPLVLKFDNGSGFIAGEVRAFLREAGVLPLASPPLTPSYNGSIEAGVGSIKTRTLHEAARHDRPGEWTCDDIEAARFEANLLGRPRGASEAVPDDAWNGRTPISKELRCRTFEAYRNLQDQVRKQRGIPLDLALGREAQDDINREAITKSLVSLDLLFFRRRRFTLPVPPSPMLKIS